MAADRQADDAPYRPLQKWDNLAEQRIREAQEDGLFDDLPGRGRPLTIDDNPLAGDMQVGFRLLKNAGFAPEWMELDKEIRAELEALRVLRERANLRLVEFLEGGGDESPLTHERRRPLRRWLGWLVRTTRPDESPRSARTRMAIAERERARAAYLDRASRLTERISLFNAVRPPDLWWLERTIPTADGHAADFDATCPPVPVEDDPANRIG
jgi:hypothetical protein